MDDPPLSAAPIGEEQGEMIAKQRQLDTLSGCLLGGAVGDALGAPLEFMSLAEIRSRFGPDGIRDYSPAYGRLGAITDDTQMTLFTAEGLIRADNRWLERGICHPPSVVHHAYLRWLVTQGRQPRHSSYGDQLDGWLVAVPELRSARAPGATCISALVSGQKGSVEHPLNDSKGCGGVMRVAPVGLIAEDSFPLARDLAAITHGHPSGYLAAGTFAVIIKGLATGDSLTAAIETAMEQLRGEARHEECLVAIEKAAGLARTASPCPETVEQLGAGWVAEEALAIALFCALKASSFEEGVLLAVNHTGDSDSTGSLTGNILGAMWGKGAIPTGWLQDLELRDVIEQVARDLYEHVVRDAGSTSDWDRYPGW